MFARISGVYDFMNHFLSLNRDKAWRRNVARRVDSDSWEVLDLCAGTGDLALTIRAAGKGRVWIAADFCPEMLFGAQKKKGAEDLHLAAADALNLPFGDRKVDAVTVGFGVRNFADVRRGLEEITRVLRPAGQLFVLEFFRDDPAGRGEDRGVRGPVRFGLNTVVPALGKVVGRDGSAYRYLPGSMGEFLTAREFATLLESVRGSLEQVAALPASDEREATVAPIRKHLKALEEDGSRGTHNHFELMRILEEDQETLDALLKTQG